MPFMLRLLTITLRIKFHDKPDLSNDSAFVFWHSKMLAGWWIFRDKNYAALVSQSKDGEILSNLLHKWNYKVVRGSSSKGGKEAVKEIINYVKSGTSAVITPDGPRGPAKVIKNGVLVISKECGIPVIPVKITYSHKIILSNSWDKFEIPLPFTKCNIVFGSKHYYKEFLENKELDNFKKILSAEMT